MSQAVRVTDPVATTWSRRRRRGSLVVPAQATTDLQLVTRTGQGSVANMGIDHSMAALHSSALLTSWRFRLLHFIGLMLTLPLFAVERVLLGSWCEWRGETVFARADRTVLMALEYVFLE